LSVPVIDFRTPKTVRQNYYIERLDAYGVNIEKIIQKYGILGIEAEPASEKLVTEDKPKVFIVHRGKSGVLEKLREFIEALVIKPLIVEMLSSKGMTLADKVKKY
jgi:hypothetical protein